jgi:hypothetical protein
LLFFGVRITLFWISFFAGKKPDFFNQGQFFLKGSFLAVGFLLQKICCFEQSRFRLPFPPMIPFCPLALCKKICNWTALEKFPSIF